MIFNVPSNVSSGTNYVTTNGQVISSQVQQQLTPTAKEDDSDRRAHIRKAYRNAKISEHTTAIILCAWKPGTHKQYSVYICKWNYFYKQRQISGVAPDVNRVIEFLTTLYDEGLGYSAINTARSALSQFIVWKGSCTIGAHPWVVKFMKGVYNLRPLVPRYDNTWDVSVLLEFLRSLTSSGTELKVVNT